MYFLFLLQNGSKIVTPQTLKTAVIFIQLFSHSIIHTFSVAICFSITIHFSIPACFFIFACFNVPTCFSETPYLSISDRFSILTHYSILAIFFQSFGVTSSKVSLNSIRRNQKVTSANCLTNFGLYTKSYWRTHGGNLTVWRIKLWSYQSLPCVNQYDINDSKDT